MKPSSAQLRQLRKDNLKWPEQLQRVPREDWPPELLRSGLRSPVIAAYRSRSFLVQIFDQDGWTRLSINRTDFDERTGRFREDISWDDIQRLKAEAGYGGWVAVELYPPDEDVVNVANMRHIFLLDEIPPFMWHKRKVAA